MPLPNITPAHLQRVTSREALFAFLRDGLDWPVNPEDTFTYPIPLDGRTLPAEISRLVPFGASDPHPILLVETEGEFRRRELRDALRAVRANMRERALFAGRSVEDLIFVVASEDYRDLRFCRFTERPGAQPKLSAFGWRPEEPAGLRTLIDYNLSALRMPPRNVLGETDWSQAKWDAAWDVEAVTDQFFKEYRRVFQAVEGMIEGVRGDRRLFTQRLFNRLMFVRFLEKKGWLRFPYPTADNPGSTDYLRALREAARVAGENFYEQRLYHAFFHGLGVINSDRRVHDLKFWRKQRGDVPFLNGGLFELEGDDEFGRVRIPNEAFDLVLDELFARWNFTIYESAPEDVDVAVDPEMLGKVFEELVTGRHETGSYYTPRPVVAFMCREALKGYLADAGTSPEAVAPLVDRRQPDNLTRAEAERLLECLLAVKVVDPACGSGAYLLGMLHELFELAGHLEIRAERLSASDQYHRKLRIIRTCLYGVDKDEFAVNIARLRLWLSLTVQFDGPVPEPLPNLDFKIEIGDSILTPDPTARLSQIDARANLIEQFLRAKDDYFDPDQRDKPALKTRVTLIRADIASWTHPGDDVKRFDWAVDFAEIFQSPSQDATCRGGFDIVLANPPYVRQELIRELKPTLSRFYPDIYVGTADLYCYFYARGIQLLRSGGILSYISSNKWFRAAYGRRLRSYVSAECHVDSITDFGELPVFRTAATFPTIVVARRMPDLTQGTLFTQVKSLDEPYPDVRALIRIHGIVLPTDALSGDRWTLVDEATAQKLRRMELAGGTLGDYVQGQLYRGLVTGLNQAFFIERAKYAELIRQDSRSSDLIEPLAIGDDVRKWHIASKERWIIVTPIGVPIATYPAIKAHLSQWTSSLEVRADRGNEWWELRSCSYYDEFRRPKIVFPEICSEPRFAYDESGMFTNNKAFIIPTDDLYLLGVLNSASCWNYAKVCCSALGDEEAGGRLMLQWVNFRRTPIPNTTDQDRIAIASLVRQVLQARGSDRMTDVARLEREIDARVDFLYFHRQGDEPYEAWQSRVEAEAAGEVGALRALIQTGEGQTTEFKGSLLWDLRQDRHNTVMRDEVLKEICAFLNADGGTLLCGVDDAGKVLGLRNDLKHAGNRDRLGLQLTNTLGDLLRPHPVELAQFRWISIDGETVLRIDVEGDPTTRYESRFDGRMKTFVRIAGSAKALEGQDLINWWDRRRARQI